MRRRLTAKTLAKPVKAAGSKEEHSAFKVMGDLAEVIRKTLADEYDARPPGLQTMDNGDGSLSVIANNPEVELGVEVKISPITQQQPAAPMGVGPQPQQPNMGIGPQMPNFQPQMMPGAAGPMVGPQMSVGPQMTGQAIMPGAVAPSM